MVPEYDRKEIREVIDGRDPARVVALLWGGDPLHSYASPIAFVVNELGLEVATGDGDTKQFHEPVVVPSHEELLARLKSEQGKRVASFLRKHVAVISDLISSDRRVGVTWSRHNFHRICNAIIENVAIKSTPLPAEMIGVGTKAAFEELGAALIERGSPELGAAIEEVRGDIEWMIGRPYADLADGN